jgi:hypothetical protein
MKKLDSNKEWESRQQSTRDLRATPDDRYINHKTATAWTKYYNSIK